MPEHSLLEGSSRSLFIFVNMIFSFTLFFSQILFSVLYETAKIVNMTNSQQGEPHAELTYKRSTWLVHLVGLPGWSAWLVYLAGPVEISLTRLGCCLPECLYILRKVACFKLVAFGKVTPGGSSCCSLFEKFLHLCFFGVQKIKKRNSSRKKKLTTQNTSEKKSM